MYTSLLLILQLCGRGIDPQGTVQSVVLLAKEKFDSIPDWLGGRAASCRQILNLELLGLSTEWVAADIMGLERAGRAWEVKQLAFLSNSSCVFIFPMARLFSGFFGAGGRGLRDLKFVSTEFLSMKKIFLVVIVHSFFLLGSLELICFTSWDVWSTCCLRVSFSIHVGLISFLRLS